MRSLCSFVAGTALILCGTTNVRAQSAPPPANPPLPAAAPTTYSPPAGYVAQPGYPPAGQPYVPPPGYAPPPPVAKHGFLALVFLGVHSFRGSSGNNLDAGLRTGAILGGRLNNRLSLNGELTLDVLNPTNVPSGTSLTAAEVELTVSPLLHVPLSEKVELVLGPKLGIWAAAASATTDGLDSSSSAHGLSAGVNLGVFGAVSRSVSLGALVSFVLRDVSEVCQTAIGDSESCRSDNLPDSDKVLSFAAGALF